ncbi:MAG: hypothetical protein ACNS64_12675 [Candidatus Halalkalibacterium sp. M3_1C_030]
MKRIHIVGVSPRSGTTLLAEAIDTCFNIDYSTDHEDELFTRAPGNPDVFLSKCPKDIMVVGPSLKTDPNLYVICMIRDPRDIVSSIHRKDPERYWAGLKFWKLYTSELPKLIKYKRFILIPYEELVSEPDKVQSLISDKIPFLKKELSFSQYHKAANVSKSSEKALGGIRPIRPKSVGKWRKHKGRIAGQLKLHGQLTPDLVTYGYENDSGWLEELEGVEPDLSQSHFSEYMTTKEILFRKSGKYLEALRRKIECLIGYRIRITHPKKWF